MHPATNPMPKTVVVTGAMGFIGSCLAAALHRAGHWRVVISDDFSRLEKSGNLTALAGLEQVDRTKIAEWLLTKSVGEVSWVLHMGARTDTTEFDDAIFDVLNREATKTIWLACTERNIPLIYASSAATYGGGEHGYSDDHASIADLHPLNPYGWSKQDVDTWVLQQTKQPPHWYGLKFFNVYGPNEFHKARMASVIFHAFNQMKATGKVKLFRSHRPEFEDGYQLRDFVYVCDVINVITWLMENTPANGIYNLGTGKAESFYQLAASAALAMQIPLVIEWMDIPSDIRDTYQYFTEADMHKLIAAGYHLPFKSLADGVHEYVTNYLIPGKHF